MNSLSGNSLYSTEWILYEWLLAAWRFPAIYWQNPNIFQEMNRQRTDISSSWSWWTRTCRSSKALCVLIVSTCLELISSIYNSSRGGIYSAYELFFASHLFWPYVINLKDFIVKYDVLCYSPFHLCRQGLLMNIVRVTDDITDTYSL